MELAAINDLITFIQLLESNTAVAKQFLLNSIQIQGLDIQWLNSQFCVLQLQHQQQSVVLSRNNPVQFA